VAGKVLSASNAVAQERFAYDSMDRLTAATTTVGGVSFANQWRRDLGGLVTNVVYAPGKSLTRTYDTDGRLVEVKDWLGHTWAFAWDGAGKPTGATAPGGIVNTNTFDSAGQLSGWRVGTLVGRSIERDEAGKRVRDTITAGSMPAPSFVRYADNTFDAADRLTAAQVRYGSHTNEAVSETYTYNGNGALTNVTSGATNIFSTEYNALGQFSSLRLSASERKFSYDALANRVGEGERLWIPDHADPLKRPLFEADTNGAPVRYYIWGPGRLLGFVDASNDVLTVVHSDEQGSVIALTDGNGNVLHTAHYGPNGQDWGRSGTNETPFAWLGGHGVQRVALSSPLGPLYLTRHRLYAASLNRFLSADPLGISGGLNLYAYAEGNPLAYIDPLGLCADGNFVSSSGKFVADTFLNAGDIQDAWALVSDADYGTGWGWAEGAVGAVGVVSLTADAAFNFIPGKVAASTAIKTGAKEVAEAVGKALARNADEVAQAVAKGLPPLRQQYVDEVMQLEEVALASRGAGASTEATARLLYAERNALKLKYRGLSPADAVKQFEQRNIEKYGNSLGPTIDQLQASGKSWDEIIESATRPGGSDLGF
jgi:RHS repeat-associated protein